MKLYLDSNAIIYAHEGPRILKPRVIRRMLDVVRSPDGNLVTSILSRLECRVKPLKEADDELLRNYDAFFSSTQLRVAPLSTDVIERATYLRANYSFRTADALHLATALEERAANFLTGDKQLSRCSDLKVELI